MGFGTKLVAYPNPTVVLDPGVGPLDAGSVLFADSSGNITEDNANFFYDNTSNRLHVGSRGSVPGTASLNAYADISLLEPSGARRRTAKSKLKPTPKTKARR